MCATVAVDWQIYDINMGQSGQWCNMWSE